MSYYQEHEAENAMAVVAGWIGRNADVKVRYHNGTAVNADIHKGVINVPKMACASGVTQEALTLLRGRVYHESGHIAETKISKDDQPKGSLFGILNALEDRRIESKLRNDHLGCGPVFKWNNEYYNKKIAELTAGKKAPLWEALCAMGLMVDSIRPAWNLSPKAQKYFDAAYSEFIKVAGAKDVYDCLEIAKRIHEIIKDINEQEEKKKGEGRGDGKGEGKSKGKDKDKGKSKGKDKDKNQQEQEEENSKEGESEDSESNDSESDEESQGGNESEDDEDSDSDEEDSEGGKAGDSDEEESDEESDGKESGGKDSDEDDEDSESESKSGDDKSDDKDADDDSESGGKSSGGESDSDESKDEDSDEGDESGSDGIDADDDSDGEDEKNGKDKSAAKDQPYEPKSGEEEKGDKEKDKKRDEKIEKKLEEELDGVDKEDIVNERLEEIFKDMNPADLKYLALRDYDHHGIVELTDDSRKTYEKNRSSISAAVTSLTGAFEQALRALARCRKKPYLRHGKIDKKRLVAIAKGTSKEVFFKKRIGETIDTAVSILIDESGSMKNSYQQVRLLAIAVAEALYKAGIPFEIIGSTTLYGGGDARMPPLDGLTRTNPIVYQHYKGFSESWQAIAPRIAETYNYKHNIDGEVIEYAANVLAQRDEARKVIFSLSDGRPESGHDDDKPMCENLKRVCERCRKSGIEVYGFGIGTESPERFYGKKYFLYLDDVFSMGSDFVRKMVDILTKGRVRV